MKATKPRYVRSISLGPNHEEILRSALAARPELNNNASLLFRELLEGLDARSGRAKSYIEARDAAIAFEEDVARILTDAGWKVERGAVEPASGHRVDLLVSRQKRKAIVELKSSARRDRLELALGSAILLAKESGLAVLVCVPYLIDSSMGQLFAALNLGLCDPSTIVHTLEQRVK